MIQRLPFRDGVQHSPRVNSILSSEPQQKLWSDLENWNDRVSLSNKLLGRPIHTGKDITIAPICGNNKKTSGGLNCLKVKDRQLLHFDCPR